MTTATATARPSLWSAVERIPGMAWLARLVGPAALTAAGMIGAGAVATRLLTGAWFGFDLLWVALYVIPMVIVTIGLQRGFTGRFIRRMPASSGVRPLFLLLQRQQAVTMFSHVLRPPFAMGTT